MKVLTIGGVPGAGKTYTSRLLAKQYNFLALEFEALRWDYFNDNLEQNLYAYTQTSLLENESMREYYMRCSLYENKIPLKLLIQWHKATMNFIQEKIIEIIREIKLIKTKQDYLIFCNKYEKLINYAPNFKILNKEYIIFSHAFMNTINFPIKSRIKIDFTTDKNTLICRFKQRENILDNSFDKNIEIYYKSYEEVLKDSDSTILNTADKNILEKINKLIKGDGHNK